MSYGTCIIMIGLPGSGKTTFAKALAEALDSKVVSADDYMVNDQGEFTFDPARLGECHNASFCAALDEMHGGVCDALVIANTNMTNMERAPYVALARAFGYKVKFVQFLAVASEVLDYQTHGVPMAKLEAMARRWEPIPAMWAEPHDVVRVGFLASREEVINHLVAFIEANNCEKLG